MDTELRGLSERPNLRDVEEGTPSASKKISLLAFLKEVKDGVKDLRGVFWVYFLFTILFWGTQDFLLSFLASRHASLESGDTLAFLSIGNLIGMLLAKLILWQWKKLSWAAFVGDKVETIETPHSSEAASSSPSPPSSIPEPDFSPPEIHRSYPSTPRIADTDEIYEIPNTVPEPDGYAADTDRNAGMTRRRAPEADAGVSISKNPDARRRFDRIRKLLKKPVFLEDSYKLSFISGVIGSVAPLGYYELSARGGEASTVAPLISLYVIVPTILGLVFLKEKKSLMKFLGIALAMAAVILFALGAGGGFALNNFANIGFFCLGFFGWGIAYFIRSLAAKKGVDFSHMILMATAGLVFGNYLLVTFWFGVGSFKMDLGHGLTLMAGSCGVLGDLGFFLLSREGREASKVVPLTGSYILLPALLGFFFLEDSVGVMKIVGICLSLTALILLGAS